MAILLPWSFIPGVERDTMAVELVGLAFFAVCAAAAGILVQTRRDQTRRRS